MKQRFFNIVQSPVSFWFHQEKLFLRISLACRSNKMDKQVLRQTVHRERRGSDVSFDGVILLSAHLACQ